MYIAQQLGRYHLLDRIAFGGMAEIYRAKTFDSTGREHVVAIKRVLRHLAEDDDFLQMLVDEAKIASLLVHDNIAKVYEFVRVGDEYFIAMEFVDGRDVRSILDRLRLDESWLDPADCAYILLRALDGLHSAHEKCDGTNAPLNIVHRDVSPSNIIVSFQGQVKLCDFGIAKARLSRIQTRTGVIKGKVKYMSPEQAMGKPLDRRSDIFSAGTVLYEMLTMQCPFQAENELELIFRVRDTKYLPPSRHNPNTPPELEGIVHRALARSPDRRYPTAELFAQDLREFIARRVPNYAPSRLGRRLRELFAAEIQRDHQLLDEFKLSKPDPAALGNNLLAEVLGEGAPYTQFMPMPPLQRVATDEESTRILARVPVPEARLPEGVDLHDMKTEILDPEERASRTVKRKHRKRPGAEYQREKLRGTQHATIQRQLLPRESPAEGPTFFDLPTQILKRDKE